jgi:predicted dehydrogenase
MSKLNSEITRRTFFDLAAGVAGTALAAGKMPAQAATKTGPSGANERIRIGLIGTGNRGREVSGLWTSNISEAHYVAGCDVYQSRLDQGIKLLSDNQNGFKVEAFDDYRKILDRKDIDAVHIATPDHWHVKIMEDALAAGKDVYVEKPLSNNVETAAAGLKVYRKSSGRLVQFGTQQRSGTHFQEAAKIVQSGALGKVTHAMCAFPGTGYGIAPEAEVAVPGGLNWDAYQGPAPRHPFKAGRLRWRGWWDYGGGLITDWGVHLSQLALWYLNAETTPPMLSTGVGQYVNFVNPDHDQSPDSVMNTWQYPQFTMTFINATQSDWEFGRQGNYFFGPKGSLHVHRMGYEVRPPSTANPMRPSQTSDDVKLLMVPWREPDGSDNNSFTILHGRNFLKSMKDRSKPIVDLEAGFYASLPCLLGVKAVREGKAFRWDNEMLMAIPS